MIGSDLANWLSEKSVYTVAELAAQFRVAERTVVLLIREGKLQAYKIGKEWRVSADAVVDYLAEVSNRQGD